MTLPKVQPEAPPSEWIVKTAAQLVVGDRVAADFLPGWGDGPGEVLYLRPHGEGEHQFVSAFFVQDGNYHSSETYLANGQLRVLRAEPPATFGRGDEARLGAMHYVTPDSDYSICGWAAISLPSGDRSTPDWDAVTCKGCLAERSLHGPRCECSRCVR